MSGNVAVVNLKDCFYYYNSKCEKGQTCAFRHEPAALGSETTCIHWLKGRCVNLTCKFRHMKIVKDRSIIPCFHENQPGGCLKPECPFFHLKHKLGSGQIIKGAEIIKGRKVLKVKRTQNLSSKHENKKNSSDLNEGSGFINPFRLAKSLAEYSDFRTTLKSLFENNGYETTQVKKVISDHPLVFQRQGERVFLNPKVKICPKYLGTGGCLTLAEPCCNVHICRDFLLEGCDAEDCMFGHLWYTDHNKRILNDFKLTMLSLNELLLLFRRILSAFVNQSELKICEDFNDGLCIKDVCWDIHLCKAFVAGRCSSDQNDCKFSHDVTTEQVIASLKRCDLSVNESPRDILKMISSCLSIKKNLEYSSDESVASQDNVAPHQTDLVDPQHTDSVPVKVHRTYWSHDYCGDVSTAEICYNSVESLCTNEEAGCCRLHAAFHFWWQVKSLDKDGYWINLTSDQCIGLEKSYCDPSVEKTPLLPLDPSSLQSSSRGLLLLLVGKSKWEADFENMKLGLPEQNKTLQLRRLCTEDVSNTLPEPCTFLWYFLDKNNVWIEYGNLDSTSEELLRSLVSSSDIEKHFKNNPSTPMSFRSSSFSYTLNMLTMKQTNMKTNVSRAVRRRPMTHIVDEKAATNTNLPPDWQPMLPEERFRRVDVAPSSEEYKKIEAFVIKQSANQTLKILKIERVQTPFFYRAFQNKVQELTILYKASSSVNIQQLFHGTNPDIVPKVCEENFDWRLHGSNVGQMYGRGTYFSPFATTSYGYAKPDTSGKKFMFVAQVAVGSLTGGNSNMTRPPINPLTNVPYDSTADAISNPSIIVKYDKQEYFPEYILTLA